MTITLNRNVLIFAVLIVALGVGGFLVGTRLNDAPAASTDVVAPPAPGVVEPVSPVVQPTVDGSNSPRMPLADFKAAFDSNADMVIVDVRTADAYAAGHIPGAVNIPEAEATLREGELPRDKEIVLYCA
jgi:rhodanese-related sulfurtransferase